MDSEVTAVDVVGSFVVVDVVDEAVFVVSAVVLSEVVGISLRELWILKLQLLMLLDRLLL